MFERFRVCHLHAACPWITLTPGAFVQSSNHWWFDRLPQSPHVTRPSSKRKPRSWDPVKYTPTVTGLPGITAAVRCNHGFWSWPMAQLSRRCTTSHCWPLLNQWFAMVYIGSSGFNESWDHHKAIADHHLLWFASMDHYWSNEIHHDQLFAIRSHDFNRFWIVRSQLMIQLIVVGNDPIQECGFQLIDDHN